MSQESLTARYRPQTFAQVAGQDAVKTILSRAAATDRIAPAYLFSGTRGVGKTTVARIFAKAVNCAEGPAADDSCNRTQSPENAIFVKSGNCTIMSEGMRIAVVGVSNIVVVQSGNDILVIDKDSSQDVRAVVDIIKKK